MALTLNTSHPLYADLVELIGVDASTGLLASAKTARTFTPMTGATYPTASGTYGKSAKTNPANGSGIGAFTVSPAIELQNNTATVMVVVNNLSLAGATLPGNIVGGTEVRTLMPSVNSAGKATLCYDYSNASNVTAVGTSTVTGGAHVIVVSYGPGGSKLYVDGVLEDTDATVLDPKLGSYAGIGGTPGFNAIGVEFVWGVFFSKTLSDAEVADLTSSVQAGNVIGLLDGAGQGGTPTVTSVTVAPSSASVAGGATQQFTATVTGTHNPAQSVTWSVSGGGSINASGLYTAPAAGASPLSVTVTATSTVDSSKSGTSAVTVPATGGGSPTVTSVSVAPSTASVTGGAQQQFTATVNGTNGPSQSVTWSTSAGSINASGLLTAPAATASAQTVTVTATSVADGTKSGAAVVTVPAAAGAGQFITDTLFNNTNGAALANISIRWSWFPAGRLGALAAITPIEGVGTTNAQGRLTCSGLPAGAGLMVAAQWINNATDDAVFYQAGVVA